MLQQYSTLVVLPNNSNNVLITLLEEKFLAKEFVASHHVGHQLTFY